MLRCIQYQGLEVDAVAILLKAIHNAVGCGKAMEVVAGLEQFDQDDVDFYMVVEHDEIFAAEGADGETTHVDGVEFFDGLYPDVDHF